MGRKPMLKSNLVPYKILVGLLYREFPWATWETPNTAYIRLTGMRNTYKLPCTRLRSYLNWLNEMGYFSSFVLSRGWCRISLAYPEGHEVKRPADRPKGLVPAEVEMSIDAMDLGERLEEVDE